MGDVKRRRHVEIQAEHYDPLLRIGDVARVTGMAQQRVRSEADAGELPTVRYGAGGHRRFQWSAVVAYCRRLGIRPQGRPVPRKP